MKRRHLSAWFVCSVWFLSYATGCGLEALIGGGFSNIGDVPKPPEIKPVTKLTGTANGLASADISIRAASASIATGKADGNGAFEIELPQGTDFNNLIVEAVSGGIVLRTIVPSAKQEVTTDAGTLDAKSTASTLIVEALLSTRGLEVVNYPAQGIELLLKRANEASDKEVTQFQVVVQKLLDFAKQASQPIFRSTRYRPATGNDPPLVEQSGINPDALGSGTDYCAPGEGLPTECGDGAEKDSTAFDKLLALAFQKLTLPTCTYGEKIRVVFTLTVNQNAKDGNCSVINQFKHAKRYGGASCEQCKVYITGGVHKDSAINDPRLTNQLSNWEPNKIQMYDDGTNGDLVAGDGVWTYTMLLDAPKQTGQSCQQISDCGGKATCFNNQCIETVRIGYKYTYGLYSDVWGGTEEFPGNQRLLEIVDQNGDGFVARHDNFADETSNKDRVNTLQVKGATGLICFQEPSPDTCGQPDPRKNHPDCGCRVDQNGDGIPDVRERPTDWDQDCTIDGYRVFANAQPETVKCE
ncbi:MAG: hypothetical protein H6727_12835 [Myxococcales bacterium]|nr:hypothetical protein [Myxococcales bacterium]